MRGFIAHTLVHTYGRVTKRTLADCLKLEGATLEQYVSDALRLRVSYGGAWWRQCLRVRLHVNGAQ